MIRSDCCHAPRNVQGITDANGSEKSPRRTSLGPQVYKAQKGHVAGNHEVLDKLA